MIELNNDELNYLKRWLQTIFTDKLVIIVGSGLSCAEGLPGMWDLGKKLKEEIPSKISDENLKTWSEIAACLESDGLEGALLKHPANDEIESAIIKITAEYVLNEEQKAINKCISENKKLKFSYLLPHISASPYKIARVITTNYDRLIEFAAEYEDWGVDSMMVGRYWGKHDPELSKRLLAKDISPIQKGQAVKFVYRNHIKIYKPHGSLDWFMAGNIPMTNCIGTVEEPLIITPGIGKYKKGYGQPFDTHREKGNHAIDNASAILCIGYGFNDDHLQTHLTTKIKSGIKTLILTRSLSDNAREVVSESSNCKALVLNKNPQGTIVVSNSEDAFIPDVNWWDIEYFVKEVLENGN